jgi:hypothetical protein
MNVELSTVSTWMIVEAMILPIQKNTKIILHEEQPWLII